MISEFHRLCTLLPQSPPHKEDNNNRHAKEVRYTETAFLGLLFFYEDCIGTCNELLAVFQRIAAAQQLRW
jgi:hypothetical protein